jgi:hypothetical protein
VKVSGEAKTRRPITVPLPRSKEWAFKKPPVTEFVVLEDGTVAKAEMIRPYLHCGGTRKTPPTFVVNLPEPAKFEVRVTQSVGERRTPWRSTWTGGRSSALRSRRAKARA